MLLTLRSEPGDEPGLVQLDANAQEIWFNFCEQLEVMNRPGGELVDMPEWAGKLPGHIARMITLLHAADHAESPGDICAVPVPENTVKRGIRFSHYLIQHAKVAHQMMQAIPETADAQYVWGRIEDLVRDESGNTVFEKQLLWQRTKGKLKKSGTLDAALNVLVDCNQVRFIYLDSSGGRKPSPLVEVNPAAFEGTSSTSSTAFLGNEVENSSPSSLMPLEAILELSYIDKNPPKPLKQSTKSTTSNPLRFQPFIHDVEEVDFAI